MKTTQMRTQWTDEELETLKMLHDMHGQNCFDFVPQFISGRTGKQARQVYRYRFGSQNITRLTPDEEVLLVHFREDLNQGWSQIAARFAGRDQIRLKNEYGRIKRTNEKLQSIIKVSMIQIDDQMNREPIPQKEWYPLLNFF
jgi:hypothetical protein